MYAFSSFPSISKLSLSTLALTSNFHLSLNFIVSIKYVPYKNAELSSVEAKSPFSFESVLRILPVPFFSTSLYSYFFASSDLSNFRVTPPTKFESLANTL